MQEHFPALAGDGPEPTAPTRHRRAVGRGGLAWFCASVPGIGQERVPPPNLPRTLGLPLRCGHLNLPSSFANC